MVEGLEDFLANPDPKPKSPTVPDTGHVYDTDHSRENESLKAALAEAQNQQQVDARVISGYARKFLEQDGLIDALKESLRIAEEQTSIPRLDPISGQKWWMRDIYTERLTGETLVQIVNFQGESRHEPAVVWIGEWPRCED